MKIHPIFPTVISESDYEYQADFKELFFQSAMSHIDENGYSNELVGKLNIHHDENYDELYVFIIQEIKKYVCSLGVDADIFNYNVVKSWLNISKDTDNPPHNHQDSHISFSYYVNLPTDIHRQIVFQDNLLDRNNLNHGMLPWNTTEWNYYNSSIWSFIPEEGSLYVFPANITHHVSEVGKKLKMATELENPTKTLDELKSMRISIAGDILMTFKELQPIPLGLQPIKNWRVFE